MEILEEKFFVLKKVFNYNPRSWVGKYEKKNVIPSQDFFVNMLSKVKVENDLNFYKCGFKI